MRFLNLHALRLNTSWQHGSPNAVLAATAASSSRRSFGLLADGTSATQNLGRLLPARLGDWQHRRRRAAQAQIRFTAPSSQFELSETVQFDRADGAALAHLERAKACLAEHQWDEAVETLRQVMENAEGKLLAVTPWRYVNLSDACQCSWPPCRRRP